MTDLRPLHEIADEITRDPAYAPVRWKAKPYVDAMRYMDTVFDNYGEDPGYLVLAYAISNLGSGYRGETAKKVKAEIKAHAAARKVVRRAR